MAKDEVGEYWIWLGYDEANPFHARRTGTGGMVLVGGSQRPFTADQVELLAKFLQGQLPILRSLEAGHTYHGVNPELPVTMQGGDTVTFRHAVEIPAEPNGGEFTLIKRNDEGNIVGGEHLDAERVTRVYDKSDNLIAYRIEKE